MSKMEMVKRTAVLSAKVPNLIEFFLFSNKTEDVTL